MKYFDTIVIVFISSFIVPAYTSIICIKFIESLYIDLRYNRLISRYNHCSHIMEIFVRKDEWPNVSKSISNDLEICTSEKP